MYIAACDDQIEELEKLTALLQAWQSDRRSDVRFQTFRSGGQLLDAARAERFTLYLLDVLMPGMTGMDAAREIRSFDAAADIIFLTTSPGFAYESYGVRALEYLLKPISGGLLFPVLDKLMLREQRPQDGLTLKGHLLKSKYPRRLIIAFHGYLGQHV
jgi:DNA-binding LytR/AlgR family response regulator